MKKFIAAFDSLRLSESTLSYAIDLAKGAGAHLVGVFLEDPHLHGYSLSELTRYEGTSFDQHVAALNSVDDHLRQASISRFRHVCQSAGISYALHRDRGAPIDELLAESIYADLLLVSADTAPGSAERELPSVFARGLLQEAQCALLLLPVHYRHITRVCLLYDGSPASVEALRTFSYVFCKFKQLETEVITVRTDREDGRLPGARLIREFVKRHYPAATYTLLKGDPEEEIVQYLEGQRVPAFIVLGAYRRGALSRLFRPSMADGLLRRLGMPLFVAPH
ncbi:MAG: universal stress protein [Chitinophagaceae bacterium]|nr:MAG: universal stress protein [Chitinophagaceae bacterium]